MKPNFSYRSLSIVSVFGAVACGGSSNGNTGSAATDPTSMQTAPSNECGIQTQFPGDDHCILPPDPSAGFQLHVGPTDYDNPGSEWTIEPGGETLQCYHLYTPNTDVIYYFNQQYRMRTGSHHLIIQTSSDNTSPEGWAACSSQIVGAIGGTQRTSEDFPPGGQVAPEDTGLGRRVNPGTPLDLQLHFFNATDAPILKEVWVNFLYKDPSQVTNPLGELGGFAQVQVPPHSSLTTGNTCQFAQALTSQGATSERIVALFGHAHVHNTRFVVYWDKADGTSPVVYDSYDGAEAPTFVYNSIVQNPVSDADSKTTGAVSGDLVIGPGEQLRFSCDITNNLDTTLYATEQVQLGEMCNLFGTVEGAGFPCFKLSGVTKQ